MSKVFASSCITQEELRLIVPKYKEVTFNKNDYVLNEGQVEKKYWFIESGFVRSYIIDNKGNDTTFILYATGDVVIDYPSMFFFCTIQRKYSGIDRLCLLGNKI